MFQCSMLTRDSHRTHGRTCTGTKSNYSKKKGRARRIHSKLLLSQLNRIHVVFLQDHFIIHCELLVTSFHLASTPLKRYRTQLTSFKRWWSSIFGFIRRKFGLLFFFCQFFQYQMKLSQETGKFQDFKSTRNDLKTATYEQMTCLLNFDFVLHL